MRSYSRTTGSTSTEAVTATPGSAARSSSATRCSCAGLAKPCSRQTRDRLHAEAAAGLGGFRHAGLVERGEHDAAGPDALDHLQHAGGGTGRRGLRQA